MKIHKKAKFKKLVTAKRSEAGRTHLLLTVLVVVSAILIAVSALLLHRPAHYNPLDFSHSKEVSLYLTHELLPALYNGAQGQEPFNLVVTQEGINDVVARFGWPKEFSGIRFSAPMVFFVPDSIVLMGTVVMEGVEVVGTVIAEPTIDADGLLNLHVVGVKIGAVDVMPLAQVLAKEICEQRFADKDIDPNYLWNKMIAAMVEGRPFEPVFKIEDKKVRVKKIKLEQKKLTISFVPVFD